MTTRALPAKAAVLATALAGSAFAGSRSDIGTSSGQFLRMGVDARAAAMGQAYGALASDASAVYWNPAGLSRLRNRHLSISHAFYVEGIFYDFIAYAQPVELFWWFNRKNAMPTGKYGTLGLGILYLNSGSVDEVDNTGTATGGAFTPQDLAGFISWGGSAGPFDLGLTAKFVQSKIKTSAQTISGDAGLRLRIPTGGPPLIVAASGHNLFGELKFMTDAAALPKQFRLGLGMTPARPLSIGAEAVLSEDDESVYGGGAEYRYPLSKDFGIAARIGYNSFGSGDDLEKAAGLALGAGLAFPSMKVDYAWLPLGFFGDTHRLTLGFRF